jgi:hypothetical protein
VRRSGLNWWAAVKLFEDGWISFSPENTPELDEAQEAELRFVGALVNCGCDRNMLKLILASLPKPYAYDLKRLFYDWSTRRWRLLPIRALTRRQHSRTGSNCWSKPAMPPRSPALSNWRARRWPRSSRGPKQQSFRQRSPS